MHDVNVSIVASRLVKNKGHGVNVWMGSNMSLNVDGSNLTENHKNGAEIDRVDFYRGFYDLDILV